MEMEAGDRDSVTALAEYSAASVLEASGGSGALPSAIKPLDRGMTICAAVVTARCPPGDNLALHRALDVAQAGEVLVAECGGAYEFGYWGELMTLAARKR